MSKKTIQLEPITSAHQQLMPFFPADMFAESLKPGANAFAVRDGAKCVGLVSLHLRNPETPELLVFTDPAEGNKGYATAAITEMLRIAFTQLKVSEVYAGCRPGRAAAHIVEKLGFVAYSEEPGTVYYVLHHKKWTPVV